MAPSSTELERWNQIISDLQGTCKSITEMLCSENAEELRDNIVFLSQLDDQIFCCDACSWWCDSGEAIENSFAELICASCSDIIEEEDDA